MTGVRGRRRVGLERSFARGAWTALLVGLIAGIVWVSAPVAEARLSWLALPGGAETTAQSRYAETAGSEATTHAAGFEGSRAERVAVRASHSLVLLGIAVLLGTALHGLAEAG